jgi:hypothetical protein
MPRDVDDLYPDEAPPSGEETRAMLRSAAAYRDVCAAVRRSCWHSLIFGGMMVSIWYFAFPQKFQYSLFGLIYLGLGVLEFTVGWLNFIRPTPEGILFEGIVLIAFALQSIGRHALEGQMTIYLAFGVWMGFSGVSHIRNYFKLRKLFPVRPSRANLKWFDSLIRDVRAADPETDPTALDLPTRPAFRAKLLGENAFFLANGTNDLIILSEKQVEIEPHDSDNGKPTATLYLGAEAVDDFRLDPDNWRNYAEWKAGQKA